MGGCGTLILSYISRISPFLEVQNFELHFWGEEGSGGAENKYVWRYDEIMTSFTFLGVIFNNLGLFKVKEQIWKMFLGLLNFKYFLGMPDIPYIFGGKK